MITVTLQLFSNTNTGWVPFGPTANGTDHSVIQAFSHWTYRFTNHELMVVDCQGVYNAKENSFYLTDPAIHCTSSLLRFGGSNLGKDGVARFLDTHKCSSCCTALGLSEVLEADT